MSSREKGNRSERNAVEELKRDGWIVMRVKGSSKWNKNVDFWSDVCPGFDICAKKKPYTRWIQVKTNRAMSCDSLKSFLDTYCSEYESVETWNWIDRKGFKKNSYGCHFE